MAKDPHRFAKRQRELAKQKKKEEKRRRKLERDPIDNKDDSAEAPSDPDSEDAPE